MVKRFSKAFIITLLLMISLITLAFNPSFASQLQSPKPLKKHNRVSFEIGLWQGSISNSYYKAGDYSVGLTDDLDMDDDLSVYFKINYELNKKTRLHLEYFSFDFNGHRSGTSSIAFPYEAPGYTHIVVNGNYTVDSELNLWGLDASLDYKFFTGDRGYLSGVLGLRHLTIQAIGDFNGLFNVNYYNQNTLVGTVSNQTTLHATYKLDGSVPYLGIIGRWEFTPNLALNAIYDASAYTGSGTSGDFSDLTLTIDWRLNDSSYIQLGYKDQELSYKDREGRKSVLSLKGPMVLYKYKF